jgi:hypothetical protein
MIEVLIIMPIVVAVLSGLYCIHIIPMFEVRSERRKLLLRPRSPTAREKHEKEYRMVLAQNERRHNRKTHTTHAESGNRPLPIELFERPPPHPPCRPGKVTNTGTLSLRLKRLVSDV